MNNKKQNNLKILQADRRVRSLRRLADASRIRTGWILYMRTVLGMRLKDLAQRAGISVPTVAQSEKREAEGKVTLETLKKMANAMDCDLVYAFVPRQTIHETLRSQAIQKASQILRRADTHMTLEDQKVKEKMEDRIRRLAQKLLDEEDVW